MAVYKVPQDVEADDKLIGPFGFRQFIYLLMVAGLIALAWALAQIFPFFAIIPVIPAIFLLILALPLRKDQPMETYIVALIQFYLKPNKRLWNPGQRESTITITAPKTIEQQLTKNLTEEEAASRLAFLADVVDSEGQSIKTELSSPTPAPVQEDFVAETNNALDVLEPSASTQVTNTLESEADRRRRAIVEQMRASINNVNDVNPAAAYFSSQNNNPPTPVFNPATFVSATTPPSARPTAPTTEPTAPQPNPSPALVDLSNNADFSVATIAKEANRRASHITDNDEVYVSLH